MNNNTFIHKYISSLITKDDICADMTCGNGNDTLFLLKKAKLVYAFDISEEAIESTRSRTKGFQNLILIHDSHVNADIHIKDRLKLAIFNLGYLPYAENPSITKANDTLVAFRKTYELLEDNGYLVITFYLGHKGGRDEYYLLDDHIKKNSLFVQERYSQDRINSPITYIIKKIS